jgi:hypothetical protein
MEAGQEIIKNGSGLSKAITPSNSANGCRMEIEACAPE